MYPPARLTYMTGHPSTRRTLRHAKPQQDNISEKGHLSRSGGQKRTGSRKHNKAQCVAGGHQAAPEIHRSSAHVTGLRTLALPPGVARDRRSEEKPHCQKSHLSAPKRRLGTRWWKGGTDRRRRGPWRSRSYGGSPGGGG